MLTSCEEMFTTNLFAELDKLDLSNMSSEEKAVAVLDDTEGALEDLSDSEVQDLLDDLSDLYSNSSSDNTKMQAAAAYSEVVLAESGANETLANLNDLANDALDDPSAFDEPGDILSNLFSDGNGNPLSASEVEDQLSAMLSSYSALTVYGAVLGDGGTPPAGVNPDELALTAMVVGLVNYINVNDGKPDATSISDLADAIVGNDYSTLPMPTITQMSTDMDTVFGSDLANTIEGSGTVTSLLDMMG